MGNVQRHIDVIVENINSQRCIFLLGPKLACGALGMPLQQEVLLQYEGKSNLEFEADLDYMVRFKVATARQYFYTDLKKYYLEHGDCDEIHKKLAQIPGHLYLSFTPDLKLRNGFLQSGIEHEFAFYNKKKNPKNLEQTPSVERPLVYNILGSFEEEQSLVLTHDDLFDYLFSILGADQKLPLDLRSQLSEGKTFVFLGFDFEAWYVKLLLRLLNVHTQGKVPLVSQGENRQAKLKNFYITHFQMRFLDLEAEKLVDLLFKRFNQPEEGEFGLRQLSDQKQPEVVELVRNLIRTDRVFEAFDPLYEFLEGRNPQLYDELTLLEGRFTRNERKYRSDTLKEEEYRQELNRICESILAIVDQLKGVSG